MWLIDVVALALQAAIAVAVFIVALVALFALVMLILCGVTSGTEYLWERLREWIMRGKPD